MDRPYAWRAHSDMECEDTIAQKIRSEPSAGRSGAPIGEAAPEASSLVIIDGCQT